MILNKPAIKPEYRESIGRVLHYINQHLADDVSLETLAGVASYSPFHFQKIFSEALSETPKQYVLRLRLERAAHFIKLFPHLEMNEFVSGCGFSSGSIFSRAFKNYYGISPKEYRNLASDKLHEINMNKNHFTNPNDFFWINPITDIQKKTDSIKLSSQPKISTFYSSTIACIQTSLSHKENIPFAFKSVMQWAIPNGLITDSTKYFSIWLDFPFITPPDKCRYLCGIEISSEIKPAKGISLRSFSKGQYLTYGMTGTMNDTLDTLVALNHNYADPMGYTISEMVCYEQFEENPAEIPYELIRRNLIFPVKIK